jgi:hypothetical protein
MVVASWAMNWSFYAASGVWSWRAETICNQRTHVPTKSFAMRPEEQNGSIAREAGRTARRDRSTSPGVTMKSKFTPRLLVAALVLALGAGGAAFAMSPERCGAGGGRMEHGWVIT